MVQSFVMSPQMRTKKVVFDTYDQICATNKSCKFRQSFDAK